MNTYIKNNLDGSSENIYYCQVCKRYSICTKPTEYKNCTCGNELINPIEQSLTDYHNHIVDKKHFEDNMLDGDLVEDCGSAMLSAKSVWEYLQSLQDTNPKE